MAVAGAVSGGVYCEEICTWSAMCVGENMKNVRIFRKIFVAISVSDFVV